MIGTLDLVLVDAADAITEPPRCDIRLARGESARVRCTLKRSVSGVLTPMALTSDHELVYGARKKAKGATVINRRLEKLVDLVGGADLVLDPADTAALKIDTYPYSDFWLRDLVTGGAWPISALSSLYLRAAGAALDVAPTDSVLSGALVESKTVKVTFTATDTVVYTFNGFQFADATYSLQPGAPLVTAGGPGIFVNAVNKTAQGFTLEANGEFTGEVWVDCIGVLA